MLLVGLLTGRVSGWLPLPKGKALCSCRGCSSNLWLVGEGRAAGHGLILFIYFSGVAVLLLPHQSLGSLRALLWEKIPSVGILIALA